MSAGANSPIPRLGELDFDPGLDHVAEAYQGEKIFAILHRSDPTRSLLQRLVFPVQDDYIYLFIHGSEEVARFQNLPASATHEIPALVVAQLLRKQYGAKLIGARFRVCSCYGTLLRPGEAHSPVQSLAAELPNTELAGYHGLVHLRANPAEIRLGCAVAWDPQIGPVIVGPPGDWELVTP